VGFEETGHFLPGYLCTPMPVVLILKVGVKQVITKTRHELSERCMIALSGSFPGRCKLLPMRVAPGYVGDRALRRQADEQ
jgi:hypothetical protein